MSERRKPGDRMRTVALTDKGMAATAHIAKPKVEIRTAGTGTAIRHIVWCSTPGCAFVYAAAVKSDANDQAKWHRNSHRTGGAE